MTSEETGVTMPAPVGARRDLGDACVEEALSIIAQRGLEALSLREVARRLGVSHQAPYKHYPSRDHLLAEVIRRCFERFATAMRSAQSEAGPEGALRALGETYLSFAAAHPLEYRLMFGTPWPRATDTAILKPSATAAFAVLAETLHRLDPSAGSDRTRLDALFVWATMHGLATLRGSNALDCVGVPTLAGDAMSDHAMNRIGDALTAHHRGPALADPSVLTAEIEHRASPAVSWPAEQRPKS